MRQSQAMFRHISFGAGCSLIAALFSVSAQAIEVPNVVLVPIAENAVCAPSNKEVLTKIVSGALTPINVAVAPTQIGDLPELTVIALGTAFSTATDNRCVWAISITLDFPTRYTLPGSKDNSTFYSLNACHYAMMNASSPFALREAFARDLRRLLAKCWADVRKM
ncbi:hypothetical protein [Rhizobacter fulvus]